MLFSVLSMGSDVLIYATLPLCSGLRTLTVAGKQPEFTSAVGSPGFALVYMKLLEHMGEPGHCVR